MLKHQLVLVAFNLIHPQALYVFPLQAHVTDSVIHILDALFECTLEMINKDLEEFPEHRINFFKMLQSINKYCFPGQFCLYVVLCLGKFDWFIFICSFTAVVCTTIQVVP